MGLGLDEELTPTLTVTLSLTLKKETKERNLEIKKNKKKRTFWWGIRVSSITKVRRNSSAKVSVII